MAHFIAVGKEAVEVSPKNGADFKLEELRTFVGGSIEIAQTIDGRIMVLNEEGKLLGLPINDRATLLYVYGSYDPICGDVLVCDDGEVL